ncbi:hypothetical protein B0J13DRAFT_171168 [Dactylonectria estremocensis]|uniref:Uncharacterized protein n=1 Tax=Dactylonectria estremocensis TaxID=1079267 RepID=A0A9P9FBS1_9HYPO|nr:hypothetical protein B0J13DRAFT_171168 [Dactylonectria estremocensis]
MDQVTRPIDSLIFPVVHVQMDCDPMMEPPLADGRIHYQYDPIFAELFPKHSLFNKRQPFFLSSAPGNMMRDILEWASDLLYEHTRNRRLTMDLMLDLNTLARGIVTVAKQPRGDEQEELRQNSLVVRDATTLFHQVDREESLHIMINSLMELDCTNLVARHMPMRYRHPRCRHEITSPFAMHASYICDQVELEAAAFKRWKNKVEHGDASAMSLEQPPRLWNNLLIDVVRHARDIQYFDSLEPFSFESILHILEDANLLRHNWERPGTFPPAFQLDQLHELAAADTLLEDLWAVEVRYKIFQWSFPFNVLIRHVHEALEERYCRIQMTNSGKTCSVWMDDGSENGSRVTVIDGRESFERNGVPWVEVVNGKVVNRNAEPEDSIDARWDVDIGRVRDRVILLWDDIEAPPPKYEDRLAPYEDVVDQPPPYAAAPCPVTAEIEVEKEE